MQVSDSGQHADKTHLKDLSDWKYRTSMIILGLENDRVSNFCGEHESCFYNSIRATFHSANSLKVSNRDGP